MFSRVLMLLAASLTIAGTVAGLMLKVMVENQNESILQELSLFSDLMLEQVDTEELEKIKTLDDYEGESYFRVKKPLDDMTEQSYKNGIYYYYMIYTGENHEILGVLDFENTLTSRHPYSEWGDNVYTRVLTDEKTEYVLNDTSAYGTWSFSLKPIRGEDGAVIGVLETGLNTDYIKSGQAALVRDVMLTLFVSVAVIIMFVLEMLFFAADWGARYRFTGEKQDVTQYIPLRTAVFLIYLADSL